MARTIAAGQRADVRAPVSADLRLVADAAERDPDELASERPGHRLAEARLADPGRTGQRQHGTGATTADRVQTTVGAAVTHRQVLQDAVLHVGQAGVVGVKHRPSRAEVRVVLGPRRPRHLQHGVQPGTDPARLGRGVAGPLQPADLTQRRLADLVRQIGRLDARAVVARAVRLVLAQLLADRGELLAQQELPLALLDARRGRPQ